MRSRLYTEKLVISYGDRLIVENLDIRIPAGKITALVGPNGSGKSTILKAIARLMKPVSGSVYLDGKAIHKESTKEVAKKLAILPQSPEAPGGLLVSELVAYGRFPYQKGFGTLREEDRRIIEWAIGVTGMMEFADRPVDNLSGGQRQRAWISMALAQGTEMLLLDEPTTYLDMAHQLEVLKLLHRLNQTEKRTIVMVVHDLNHATRFADHVVAIRNGRLEAEGTPSEVVTAETMRSVFGVLADIVPDPRTGVPVCIPYELDSTDGMEDADLREQAAKMTEMAEMQQAAGKANAGEEEMPAV
ncbi:ABC transporter ATP-binding protein [Brevibacillus ruminantium]|uniref:ABC transporter ATP-binding protein n=1 Tax=Brevibacillus ruminantium TaxID=2950604 RepID=A0ABY4WNG5_9BACL|nr:ABC transporter ATP-binding protein [Brevibacillus ruminantium]USG66191.1 ABC transporter ATP-binding protein [Brevibacillus ruminantium]